MRRKKMGVKQSALLPHSEAVPVSCIAGGTALSLRSFSKCINRCVCVCTPTFSTQHAEVKHTHIETDMPAMQNRCIWYACLKGQVLKGNCLIQLIGQCNEMELCMHQLNTCLNWCFHCGYPDTWHKMRITSGCTNMDLVFDSGCAVEWKTKQKQETFLDEHFKLVIHMLQLYWWIIPHIGCRSLALPVAMTSPVVTRELVSKLHMYTSVDKQPLFDTIHFNILEINCGNVKVGRVPFFFFFWDCVTEALFLNWICSIDALIVYICHSGDNFSNTCIIINLCIQ